MHLHHPSLSLSGKKKGKKKFRNAEEARKARELDESWKDLQKKWGVEAEEKKRSRAITAEPWKPNQEVYRRETPKIPSLNSGAAVATKKETMQYTGTEMLGVTIMHKSCLQPVFSQQAAEDAAKMRR